MSAHPHTPHPHFSAHQGAERLRAHHAKLTPQRLAMLDFFEQHITHLTAQEIHAALEHIEPGLSRATVYNNLELFESIGLISRHQSDQGTIYYDPNTSPHHHMMCVSCGEVHDVEIPAPLMGKLLDPQAAPFELHAASIWFRGRCATCAAAPQAEAREENQ